MKRDGAFYEKRKKTLTQAERIIDTAKEMGWLLLPIVSIGYEYEDGAGNTKSMSGKAPSVKWASYEMTAADFVYDTPRHATQILYPPENVLQDGDLRNIGLKLYESNVVDIDLDCAAAREHAMEFFGDLGGLHIGYDGEVTHIFLRVEDRSKITKNKYLYYGEKEDGSYGTCLELRTGGKLDRDGELIPTATQTVIRGYHCDSGAKIEVMNGDGTFSGADLGCADFAVIEERYHALAAKAGLSAETKQPMPNKRSAERTSEKSGRDSDLESLAGLLPAMSELAALYAGEDFTGRGDHQQCPACRFEGSAVGNPVLSVERETNLAYCFFEDCESHGWAANKEGKPNSGFNVFQLIDNLDPHGFRNFGHLLGCIADDAAREEILSDAAQHGRFMNGLDCSYSDGEKKKAAASFAGGSPPSSEKSSKSANEIFAAVETIKEDLIFYGDQRYRAYGGDRWVAISEREWMQTGKEAYLKTTGKQSVAGVTVGNLRHHLDYATFIEANLAKNVPEEKIGVSINLETFEELPGVAFEDCVVFFNEKQEMDTKPRCLTELYTREVPHRFPRGPSPTPFFDSFMMETSLGACDGDPGEAEKWRGTVLFMLGCALFGNHFQRGFFIIGFPNTGKSILMGTAKAVVGQRNYKGTRISKLARDFGLQNIRKAKVFALGEFKRIHNSEGDEACDVMKAISGGDDVPVNIKHEEEVSVVFDGIFIGAANSVQMMPAKGEMPGGWQRRMVCLPMPDSPPAEVNHSLLDTIVEEELPGIIYKASQMFADCLKKPDNALKGLHAFPLCQASVDLMRKCTMDEIARFLEDFDFTHDEGDMVFNSTIRSMWKNFVGDDDSKPPFKSIKDAMENRGGRKVEKITNPISGKREGGCRRVRVSEDYWDPSEEENGAAGEPAAAPPVYTGAQTDDSMAMLAAEDGF